MSYKMLLNKEKFLKTEFGLRLQELIVTWDLALQQGVENPETLRDLAWCQAQWEVYQLAMKQFYGIEYYFTRTDEYFGVVTEDEADWLLKVDREPALLKKIDLLKRIHEELDHRTDVEEKAEQLISEGRYEEAVCLLNSLDDSVIAKLQEEARELHIE